MLVNLLIIQFLIVIQILIFGTFAIAISYSIFKKNNFFSNFLIFCEKVLSQVSPQLFQYCVYGIIFTWFRKEIRAGIITANQGKSWAATRAANQADLPEFEDLMVIRKMKKKMFCFLVIYKIQEIVINPMGCLVASMNVIVRECVSDGMKWCFHMVTRSEVCLSSFMELPNWLTSMVNQFTI